MSTRKCTICKDILDSSKFANDSRKNCESCLERKRENRKKNVEKLREKENFCKKCQLVRDPTSFVEGSVLCAGCREKSKKADDAKLNDPKKYEEHLKRNREKKYYQESREKQKKENPEEFLKKNAEYRRQYRARKKAEATAAKEERVNTT